ncbi:MAG: hypothetical protein Q8O84_01240 [Nanoarchaeota archaeon]|nr:hypothetical protein [Nanoarchaeota archaeon]
MEDFTWSRMNLLFPEYFKEPLHDKASLLKSYPISPEFSLNSVCFRVNKEYGVQLFQNQEIPDWLKKEDIKVNGKSIEEFFYKSFEKVYNEVQKDLKNSFEIFESWRSFIKKFNNKEWKGNLQSHIEFVKDRDDDEIRYFDYYRYGSGNMYPTDKLLKIKKIPKESLNEKFLEYYKLSQNILSGEGKCNSVTGKSIYDCVKNVDKIYKVAPELEKLRI